ncbi:MAG: hypothetical protein A2X02_03710 [Bacteroidetes bacterium GWF2_29_10]|nr:MAG: hypothetical protein A2X02_03710 [Bacteroidetes bacterium GWF2_29_10]
MKNLTIICLLLLSITLFSQKVRKDIIIPDIMGYKLLKCDFHIHTVFSDGYVWPKYRIEEAWLDGLDVIAITDHLEYKPFNKYIDTSSYDNSYLIAAPDTFYYGLKLIKGCEITKKFPPGHFNALFTTNNNIIFNSDWEISIQEARKQGAYITWNHPNWYTKKFEWPIEIQTALSNKLIDGIEIFNGKSFYKEVLDSCQKNNIAMFANTDIHSTTAISYENYHSRPMTLVFAKNNSIDEIKKALLDKHTLAFFADTLAGNEQFMKAIFDSSITYNPNVTFIKNTAYIRISNKSDIPYYLTNDSQDTSITMKKNINIPAHSTTIERVYIKNADTKEKYFAVKYKVENCLITSDKRLEIYFNLQKN